MKLKTILLIALALSVNAFAQEDKLNIVNVIVVSSGETENKALIDALRSALTQTSSVFISSNTQIINDEITKDEISMINNGSIAGYKVLDKIINSNGSFLITYEVSVSITQLSSFVVNSGGSTELQGGLFANNIKLMELNEKAELKSIKDLLDIEEEDFEINTSALPNYINEASSGKKRNFAAELAEKNAPVVEEVVEEEVVAEEAAEESTEETANEEAQEEGAAE
jgi:hypothetical protein